MSVINGLTPGEEAYYVVGGTADVEINDYFASNSGDKIAESFLIKSFKIREQELGKEDLIGKGKVTPSDGINPYWIVGGIEED